MEAVWGLVEGCMGIDMGANAHHMTWIVGVN